MNYSFYKMYCGTNDFVIFLNNDINLNSDMIEKICDRKTGIGCDQLILSNSLSGNIVSMKIWNSDGSYAGACGNASRCLGKLYLNNSLKEIQIKTDDRILSVNKVSDQLFSVNMGKAYIKQANVYIEKEYFARKFQYQKDQSFFVDIGNKHLIIFCNHIDYSELELLSNFLKENYLLDGININYIKIQSHDVIELAVWEHGSNFTGSCGTGACASAFAAYFTKRTGKKVKIIQKSEIIDITISNQEEIIQTGLASLAFKGNIDL